MTALEEDPFTSTEQRYAETPLAEHPTRLLGEMAIQAEPQDLCDSILNIAITAEVQTPADFSSLLHTVLLNKVRRANEQNHRTTDAGVVNPQRVQDALADYYLVFPGANTPQDSPPTNKAHRQHLTTHAQNAQSHLYSSPEINLLLRLETDLREQAGDPVANAALDLLAAYGWAIRGGNGYAEARLALYRSAGKSQMLANKRPQQRR
jgi:hypothetical protein